MDGGIRLTTLRSKSCFGYLLTTFLVDMFQFWMCLAPNCGFQSCFDCRGPAHRGLTCAEQKASDKKDPLSEKWKQRNTRNCVCGRPCEKIEGCDKISCPRPPVGCGKQWCWECGEEWSRPHGKKCPHFGGTGYNSYQWGRR